MPNVFPKSAESEFLKVEQITSENDYFALLGYFKPDPVFLVTTDMGCSCNFRKGEMPDDSWEDDKLKQEAISACLEDRERVSSLHQFCSDLAMMMSDRTIKFLGVWANENDTSPVPVKKTEYDLDDFFRQEDFFIEELNLVILKKNGVEK